MKKNIVVLTLGYYPDMSAVSAVLDKYIQVLKKQYHFHIIAFPTKIDFVPMNDPDIKIYYMDNFWRNVMIKNSEQCKKNPTILNKMVYLLLRIRGAFLGLIEDYGVIRWMEKSSFRMLEQLSKDMNIDVIISVSGLFVFLHDGAKRFKEKNPHVKWITFITDPISFSSSKFKRFKFNEKKKFNSLYNKEKSIYDSADYNIFLENLYYDAIDKFKQPESKTFQFKYVLENMQPEKYCDEKCKDVKTRMIYAGALYREIRNPEYMLSVISQIPDIHLDMFVPDFQCLDIINRYKSDKIVLHESVGIERYKEMITNEYDILINIGNNCTNQAPSKMYELLSTGKPIINFFHYKESQYELIEKYPLGINIGREDKDAVEKVKKFCIEMRGKRLQFSEVEKIYPENSLKEQIPIFERLINA